MELAVRECGEYGQKAPVRSRVARGLQPPRSPRRALRAADVCSALDRGHARRQRAGKNVPRPLGRPRPQCPQELCAIEVWEETGQYQGVPRRQRVLGELALAGATAPVLAAGRQPCHRVQRGVEEAGPQGRGLTALERPGHVPQLRQLVADGLAQHSPCRGAARPAAQLVALLGVSLWPDLLPREGLRPGRRV